MSNTILVVDDNASVRQLLREYLSKQGFQVLTADNGQDAIYTARHELPDLILLDLMMPKMDGYQFIKLFRQERRTPIIIITAREEETDAVLGLELGADDYVIKPFRMRELVARIHAVLRRANEPEKIPDNLRADDLMVDLTSHMVTLNNQSVALTPIEFNLLVTLMRSPGQVFTRSQLVDHLVESGFSGLEQTLNVHIRNLRKKIEKDPDNPRYVETVFGVGYRLKRN